MRILLLDFFNSSHFNQQDFGATGDLLASDPCNLRTNHTLNRIHKNYAISKFLLPQIYICLYIFLSPKFAIVV